MNILVFLIRNKKNNKILHEERVESLNFYSKFEININLLSANDLKYIEDIIESNDLGWYIIGDILIYDDEIRDIQKYVFESIEILIEEYEFISL